ncbi:SCP2 sterol-binding domain-containing protein [Nocardiopsis xinjiangensis]|uniref:SCP2 sterol-binding domain-containing protein n=1 Tax=Nocardiopsis xinjiangensis TaxID=124285 RepID=UPI0003454FF5|nr:SCP2 sterol-binding domain-containing protein [Nocardiopsis xinjiangensis]
MSSIDACLDGFALINRRILERSQQERERRIDERTVAVIVPDLGTTFRLRLTVEGLTEPTHHPTGAAPGPVQVTVTVGSDDLVAIAEDRLSAKLALVTRRVKINASLGDMLRMRSLTQ